MNRGFDTFYPIDTERRAWLGNFSYETFEVARRRKNLVDILSYDVRALPLWSRVRYSRATIPRHYENVRGTIDRAGRTRRWRISRARCRLPDDKRPRVV